MSEIVYCGQWLWLVLERPVRVYYIFKNGPTPASFCLFLPFLHDKYNTNTENDKSIDGVLGTRTQGDRMVGADESTESIIYAQLW